MSVNERIACEIYTHKLLSISSFADPHSAMRAGIEKLSKLYGISPKIIRDIWNRKLWRSATNHLWVKEHYQQKARMAREDTIQTRGMPFLPMSDDFVQLEPYLERNLDEDQDVNPADDVNHTVSAIENFLQDPSSRPSRQPADARTTNCSNAPPDSLSYRQVLANSSQICAAPPPSSQAPVRTSAAAAVCGFFLAEAEANPISHAGRISIAALRPHRLWWAQPDGASAAPQPAALLRPGGGAKGPEPASGAAWGRHGPASCGVGGGGGGIDPPVGTTLGHVPIYAAKNLGTRGRIRKTAKNRPIRTLRKGSQASSAQAPASSTCEGGAGFRLCLFGGQGRRIGASGQLVAGTEEASSWAMDDCFVSVCCELQNESDGRGRGCLALHMRKPGRRRVGKLRKLK